LLINGKQRFTYIKQEAKRVEIYLNEDTLFQHLRYNTGSNEVTRKLWEIVQNDNDIGNKDKDKMTGLCYGEISFKVNIE
jgi:hypothetical protein